MQVRASVTLSVTGEFALPRDVIAESATTPGVAPGLWPRLSSVVREHSDRTAFASRDGDTWRSMTFGEIDDCVYYKRISGH